MNKIIIKNALITFATLLGAAIVVFSAWLLISPQSMASACENTGNYVLAVTCADLRYKYTKDVDDLSRCAQDSISAKWDKSVVKYCKKLIEDEGFEELCAERDEYMAGTEFSRYALSYKKYIYGNLALSQYRTKNLEEAKESAKTGESFSWLVVEIIEKHDVDAAKEVIDAIDECFEELDETNQDLYDLLLELITKGV